MNRAGRIAAAAGLTAAAAGAAVGGWHVARERDRRAVEQDPERALLWRPLAGRALTVTSADGTRLHAERFGPEDGEPIVLVHGWTCGLRFWTRQIQSLSGHHPVVAYDLRGHGQSQSPAGGDFSADALAADLQAVLDATVPAPRRALLVGHSMGAMSIVAWAGAFQDDVPTRASGVGLMNTGVSGLTEEALVLPLPSRLRPLRTALTAGVVAASLPLPPSSPLTSRAVRYITLSPEASPAQVAFCDELILECRTDIRAGFARMLGDLDLGHAVEHLVVPATVVAAEKDRLTPPVQARRLAERLPNLVELVEIPGCGHMAPVQAAGDATACIERLLAATRRSQPARRQPQEVS